jgi:hypothetical protein
MNKGPPRKTTYNKYVFDDIIFMFAINDFPQRIDITCFLCKPTLFTHSNTRFSTSPASPASCTLYIIFYTKTDALMSKKK